MINKKAKMLGEGLDRITDSAGMTGALFAILIAIAVCYEIIAREIFSSPTIWQVEIAIFLATWACFLGLGFGLKEGSHVVVDVLVIRLSDKIRLVLEVFSNFLVIIFALPMTWYGVPLVLQSFHLHEARGLALNAPLWVVKVAVPFGTLLLLLQAIKRLIATCHSLKHQLGRLSDKSLFLPPLLFAFAIFLFWLWSLSPLVVSLVLLFTFLLTGVPVAFALGLLGYVGYYYLIGGMPGIITAPFKAYAALDNYHMIALPLFMLAGQIMGYGKIASNLFDFSAKWVGHLPGGLAVVTLLASTIFSAISGSSTANAATMGIIAIPLMLSKGYNVKLATGVVAAGATIDLMIPPSNAMVLYGVLTEESIGKLFMAGLIPGLIMTIMFVAWIVFSCRKEGSYEPIPAASWKERLLATKNSFWDLLAPIIILGGIYTGMFSPTEAGGVVVVYCLALSVARKTIKLQDAPGLLKDSASVISLVLAIMVGAVIFGDIINMLQFPQSFSQAVVSSNLPSWAIIGLMMVLLLILGCFMEGIAITVITVPILVPAVISMGYSNIWFCIMFTLMIQIALLTPPIGFNLFVVKGVSNAKLEDIIRGVVPFLVLLVIGLFILALFPQLSLWLPSTMR